MSDKISVIVVDDFELTLVGLHHILLNIPIIEKVREAFNGKELFELVKEEEPDLVLMDVQLDGENGIELTRQLLARVPDTLVIALSASKDVEHFISMMEAGASGFLLKNSTTEELEVAIEEVLKGKPFFSKEFHGVAKKMAFNSNGKIKISLSEREQEVLKLICLGYSNQEIAENLQLSHHTIDAHRKKLLNKTGAKNTAKMITMAIKEGLVDV